MKSRLFLIQTFFHFHNFSPTQFNDTIKALKILWRRHVNERPKESFTISISTKALKLKWHNMFNSATAFTFISIALHTSSIHTLTFRLCQQRDEKTLLFIFWNNQEPGFYRSMSALLINASYSHPPSSAEDDFVDDLSVPFRLCWRLGPDRDSFTLNWILNYKFSLFLAVPQASTLRYDNVLLHKTNEIWAHQSLIILVRLLCMRPGRSVENLI